MQEQINLHIYAT